MSNFTKKSAWSKKAEIGYHFLFWFLLAYFTLLDFNGSNPFSFSVPTLDALTFFWTAVLVISFYFNYLLVLPWVFQQFSWKRVVIGLLVLYLFFVGIRYSFEEVLMPFFFGISNYFEGTPLLYYLSDNLYFFTFPLIPSTIFWLIVFSIRLLEKQAVMAEEKRLMEGKFLKSQLNPHFLFNSLNTLYAMVTINSDKALPAIETLSNMMKYTTYEAQKDYIKIQDEIDYFRSFIALEKLRQHDEVFTQLELRIEKEGQLIPPLILSPLVENALKHGQSDQNNPIKIKLDCQSDRLSFEVKNSVGEKRKDKQGGIGLENLKKRLEIYYPGNYNFDLERQPDYFNAKLEIRF